jgi:ADP-heptose:LPS heptosyltransferase
MDARNLLPGVRKIAVLRANSVGDFFFILPALEAIRAAYPDAEIVLLGRPWHAHFLGGRPSPIDRVVAIPAQEGLFQPSSDELAEIPEPEPFFTMMREERFDIAFQFHGGGKYSNPFITSVDAKLTVGSRTPDAAPLDRWIPYDVFQPEVARYLDLASLTGARPVSFVPRLPVTPVDLVAASRAVPFDTRPFALLHPGSTDQRRRWPAPYFAQVADAIVDLGLRVVVNGVASEADIVEDVIRSMRSHARPGAIWAGPDLSLSGLYGLIAQAAVVVSNDSGPVHMAVAAETPCLGMFWCYNLLTYGPLLRQGFTPLVSWRMHCPDCQGDLVPSRCPHGSSIISDIAPEKAIEALNQLLQLRSNQPITECRTR